MPDKQLSNCTVKIDNVTAADDGEWECTVSHWSMGKVSKTFSLDVIQVDSGWDQSDWNEKRPESTKPEETTAQRGLFFNLVLFMGFRKSPLLTTSGSPDFGLYVCMVMTTLVNTFGP